MFLDEQNLHNYYKTVYCSHHIQLVFYFYPLFLKYESFSIFKNILNGKIRGLIMK